MILNIKDVGWNTGAIYVGRSRSKSMHFGNPFSHLKTSGTVRVADRDEACNRFASWLEGKSDADIEPERRAWIINNLHTLKGHDLACWCYPKRCHAQTLITWAGKSS